jgi:hypothetical protein
MTFVMFVGEVDFVCEGQPNRLAHLQMSFSKIGLLQVNQPFPDRVFDQVNTTVHV